jgi:hypothetical protein
MAVSQGAEMREKNTIRKKIKFPGAAPLGQISLFFPLFGEKSAGPGAGMMGNRLPRG